MNKEYLIPINQLCYCYNVEISFFNSLNEYGLIEINTIEESLYLHEDKISDVEKIIRLTSDLNLNIENVDIVFNLLKKIEDLQDELNGIKNKLYLHEF